MSPQSATLVHMNTNCTTAQPHCESCGSTDPEDVGHAAMRDNDGYTACCNERRTDAADCDGDHDHY